MKHLRKPNRERRQAHPSPALWCSACDRSLVEQGKRCSACGTRAETDRLPAREAAKLLAESYSLIPFRVKPHPQQERQP